MAYDYSVLLKSEDGIANTWRELWDENSPMHWNLNNILRCTVLLPHDFYDIITAYFLLPSALCRTVPYLFLYGQSGSGKSTVAKVASYLHGCAISSSSDTFAGIRNDLEKRRHGYAEVALENDTQQTWNKPVERNIAMVWDDIDASVFTNSPDIYRLFKFGSNKATDKITISGKETGTNLEFHTFCPKIFSSISPLHLNDSLKELRRRLIVIPFKRIEELSDNRKAELGVTADNWQSKLIDLDVYDWSEFSQHFENYWDMDRALEFVNTRRELSQGIRGLTTQQRSISLDLMTTGIVSGVWESKEQALERIKYYWGWFKQETEKNAGLSGLLKDYLKQEQRNASNGGIPLQLHTSQVRTQVNYWVEQGWLFEKPRPREVKEAMYDLGMRLQKGIWRKD